MELDDHYMLFNGEYWEQAPHTCLQEGDIIHAQGQLLRVINADEDTLQVLPYIDSLAEYGPDANCAIAYTPHQLVFMCNMPASVITTFDATITAMSILNAQCLGFYDATFILGVLEAGPGCLYSPRLTANELEQWCSYHLPQFKKLAQTYKAQLSSGQHMCIQPWWLETEERGSQP